MTSAAIASANEPATQAIAAQLLPRLKTGTLLALRGELGAGKSVFARAIIHAAGYKGHVKSPTYTLIETYEITQPATQIARIAHLDLYRLADPEELYYLGFDDLLKDFDLIIVEWPEKAAGTLPEASVNVCLQYADDGSRWISIGSALAS